MGLFAAPVSLWSHPNHFAAQTTPLPAAGPSVRVAGHATPRAEARLSVTIVDAKTGQRTPVRVRITDEKGEPLGLAGVPRLPFPGSTIPRLAMPGSVIGLPAEAIGVMYGWMDDAHGYAFQPDGAFYVNGSFDMPVPAGKLTLTLSKGYEFIRESEELLLQPGDRVSRNYGLRRWIDMPERGWYSADDHIHLRRSPRENALIRDWIAAEDVHVGILLRVGDFRSTYFSQYAWGEMGRYDTGDTILSSGQEEPRTSELGHTLSLGASEFVRFQADYYSYDRVFDRVRELGGVSGYAHQGVPYHGYRGMTLDVLDGKIDFLEVMQFCITEGPLVVEHYYRFLDLGYRLTALGGSDFPWCGRAPRYGVEETGSQIGDARFYTYIGGPLTFDRWLQGVKAGNTFVTTGPVLEFQVNGELPGSLLDVKPGAKLRVSAKAHGHESQIPLQRLQIIGHGNVLAEARSGEPGQTPGQLSVELDLEPAHGLWIAARTDAGPTQAAHTTPVYVTVNGDGFHNRANLAAQIAIAKGHLQEIRALLKPPAERDSGPAFRAEPGPWLYPGAVAKLERRIAIAERKLEELRGRQ